MAVTVGMSLFFIIAYFLFFTSSSTILIELRPLMLMLREVFSDRCIIGMKGLLLTLEYFCFFCLVAEFTGPERV